MNKEELIKLREQLQKTKELEQKEKYTPVFFNGRSNGVIAAYPFDDAVKTKEELMDEYDPAIDETKTLDYFETKVEEIIRAATAYGVEFDDIITYMYVYYYVNDNMSKSIKDNCILSEEKFNRNDILSDYVKISFDFNFDKKANEQFNAEYFLNNPNEPISKEFLVHYGRFISFLASHGFDVSDITFNESLQRNLNGDYPKIITNLTKDNVKSR